VEADLSAQGAAVGRSLSRTRRHRVTRTAFVAGLSALLLMGGVAYAYVKASGSGTGSATTATMQTVTVQALVGGDAPNSKLYPGGPAVDVILRINNPNSYSVTLYSISGTGTITPDAFHPGCTTTGVSFNPPSNPGNTLNPGTTLVHLSGAASMSTSSVNACQGATFSIPVSMVAHRG